MTSNQALLDVRRSYLNRRRVERTLKFAALVLLLAFGLWTLEALRIPISRVLGMFGRVGDMIVNRLLPPDLSYVGSYEVSIAVVETIEMSLLGAFVGTLISIPVAWWSAWNVTPNRRTYYAVGRAILVFARSVPTLIWGMLLVVLLGFGPAAGSIALTMLTIGFAGKLMAEQVEAIDMGPVEAIRATGASEIGVFVYAIYPQVKPAWVGIIIYNWDSVFRASTILGFVGAGGLGIYLRMTIQVLEYEQAAGIIALVIVLVVLSELLSHHERSWYQ